MRRVLAVLFLLVAACQEPQPTPPIAVPSPSPSPSPSSQPLVVSIERALHHNRVLSVDIGRRVSATPGEKAAADYLNQALVGAGLQVQRQRFSRTDGGESENIIGRIPQVDYSTGYVLVGGHYDTFSLSPGGNDNGSGAALVVALAETLANRRVPVEFVLFAAEERHPLTKDHHQGSEAYVAALSDLSLVKAMISLDMIGHGPRIFVVSDRRHASPLASEVARVAQALSIPFVTRSLGAVSDHTSFTEAGVPAILLWTGRRPEHHSKGDTFETVQPEAVDRAGRLTLEWIKYRFGLQDA